MILRASHTLAGTSPQGAEWIEGGGVELNAGRIVRVLRSSQALARAASQAGKRPKDLGEGLLLPGFVNAHAHLELTGMRLESGPFAKWIGDILRARRELIPADYLQSLVAGEARLLETGTTCVGDIASTRVASEAGRRLRSVVYREVLDAWNPERTSLSMQSVRRALPKRKLRQEGLSPHAPYTTSSGLLQEAAALAKRRGMPLSIHWSESPEELQWLAGEGGGFAAFFPPSPESSGLDLIEGAGLLGSSTSLVHGNHPAKGEPERLAAAGVVLVHCPGTHSFFGREPFRWSKYERSGVQLALGTDSRASNADLDMRREMSLARAGNPGLSPLRVFGMATHQAARALGMSERVGSILPGMEADLAFHVGLPKDPSAAMEALTHGQGQVARTYVAGRQLQ